MWWLSFADGRLPKGTQFLGACLVRAGDMLSAVARAHALGINPGGEVIGYEVPERAVQAIDECDVETLMSRKESEALDAKWMARLSDA